MHSLVKAESRRNDFGRPLENSQLLCQNNQLITGFVHWVAEVETLIGHNTFRTRVIYQIWRNNWLQKRPENAEQNYRVSSYPTVLKVTGCLVMMRKLKRVALKAKRDT